MEHRRLIAVILTLTLLLGTLSTAALADEQPSTDTFCSMTTSGRHSWRDWKTDRAPTCTKAGSRSRTCGRCGYTQTESIPRTGHSWGKWKTAMEATCTRQGEETRKCSICGAKDTRKIDKKPHSWGEWTVAVEPTDHSAGTRTHTCKVCGTEKSEDFDPEGTLRRGSKGEAVKWLQEGLICYGVLTGRADGSFGKGTEAAVKAAQEAEGFEPDGVAWPQTQAVLGHKFGEWETVQEMTDFSIGIRKRVCARCGYTEAEETWPEPTYKRGDKGDGVKGLQEKLNAAGYDCGAADGGFGGRTERAVKAIEEAHGVEADGIAWPGVQKWLEPQAPGIGDVLSGDSAGTLLNNLRHIPMDGDVEIEPLRIVLQPVGGTISSAGGESLTLEIEAEGGIPPYSYTWHPEISWLGLPELMPTVGEDLPTLKVTEGGWKYFCVVTDRTGESVCSDSAAVDSEFVIVEQPKNANLYGKDSVTLFCRAAGGEAYDYHSYIYQWLDSAGQQVAFTDDGTCEAFAEGEYHCVVQDLGGRMLTTDPCTVYSTPPLHVEEQSADHSLQIDETIDLYARFAGGIGPYTVVWERDGTQLPTWEDGEDLYLTTVTGDGRKQVDYVCVATDAMGETVRAEVAVTYPQLQIEQQPAGGMMDIDGNPFTVRMIMAEGEAPFECAAFRDGEFFDTFQSGERSIAYDAEWSGEYFFRVEDAAGRWAESDTALVQDYAFRIDRIEVANTLTHADDSTRLTAVAANTGDAEDASFSWWWLGSEDADAEPEELWESGPVVFVDRPGEYSCTMTNASGASDTAYAAVEYVGSSPIILEHPKSVTLERQSDTGDYRVGLSCRAVSGDGTTDHLHYQWQRRTANGWVDLSETGSDLDWQNTSVSLGGAIYRCKVTDDRMKWLVYSREAFIQMADLKCPVAMQIDTTHKLRYYFMGGVAPYTVEVRYSGTRPRDSMGVPEKEQFDELYEILTFNSPEEIYPLKYKAAATGTCYGRITDDGTTLRVWAFPFTWTMIVTDAIGQTCEASIPCRFQYTVSTNQGQIQKVSG